MALLEAGVAGIPVVATAVGGVPDLLRTDDGWLVPPGDAGVLARAIDHLLGDPVAAARRANAFQARVGQQDVGSWIGKYADLYDRVAGACMSPHQSNSTR